MFPHLNIYKYGKSCECVEWIKVAQYRVQWAASLDTVIRNSTMSVKLPPAEGRPV
jgi:hypothetical protein